MPQQDQITAEAPSGTRVIRINLGAIKKRRRLIFLLFMIFVLILVLYGMTYRGYHDSTLPYQFDNLVHRTGLWRLYGSKTYEPVSVDGLIELVDPRLDQVAEESLIGYVIEGAAIEFERDGSKLGAIEIGNPTGERVLLPGPYEVENTVVMDCDCYEVCADGVYMPGSLDDLKKGDIVRLEFQREYGSEWKIGQLFFIKVEWESEVMPSTPEVYF